MQTVCFYNADMLLDIMRDRFKGDQDCTFQLVDYREPGGGNKAIHFAVLSGNVRIIDFVLLEFKADP
jgi:hypothetical protein